MSRAGIEWLVYRETTLQGSSQKKNFQVRRRSGGTGVATPPCHNPPLTSDCEGRIIASSNRIGEAMFMGKSLRHPIYLGFLGSGVTT